MKSILINFQLKVKRVEILFCVTKKAKHILEEFTKTNVDYKLRKIRIIFIYITFSFNHTCRFS